MVGRDEDMPNLILGFAFDARPGGFALMLRVHVLITPNISHVSIISPFLKEGESISVLVVVVVSMVRVSTVSLASISPAPPGPSSRWVVHLGVVIQRMVGLGTSVWLGFDNFRATSVNLSGAIGRFG